MLLDTPEVEQNDFDVYIQKNTHTSNKNRPLYYRVNSFMKNYIHHEPK
jgi:hypothetical protein